MGRRMAKIEWSDKAPQAHTRSEFIITDGTMVKFVSNYDTTLSLVFHVCHSTAWSKWWSFLWREINCHAAKTEERKLNN